MQSPVGRVAEVSDPLEVLGRRHTPTSLPGVSDVEGQEETRKQFVLIVEDEADALEAMSAWLEVEGFPSLLARHGREALDLLRAGRRPALILLDIRMPIMDGKEFLLQISADRELAEIPIAVVTASAEPGDVPFRKNNAGFFLKPVDYQRLLKTVRRYCS
ncbi:MAG TPA: response regulator [Thermoanaerobaculia bacterium]